MKKVFPQIVALFVFLMVSNGCIATIPNEIIESVSYELQKPQRVFAGNRMFRASRAEYAPLYIAIRDFDQPGQTLYKLNPIKKGMIFPVVKQQGEKYLIQNPGFAPQGNMAILVEKDGALASDKPLRAMLFGGADLTQKSWQTGEAKIFERMTTTDSFDAEVIYRGASVDFFYIQYREYVPGALKINYQEILKFNRAAKEISIIGRTLQIVEVLEHELTFVITEEKRFSGYAEFESANIVSNPKIDTDLNRPALERSPASNPEEAFFELLSLASENYWGLYYDRMDLYSKGRLDSLVGISAYQLSAPDNLPERAKYIWMAKPTHSAADKFSEMWHGGHVKILSIKEADNQAELQLQYENGETEFIYMLLENGAWKFNLARTMSKEQ